MSFILRYVDLHPLQEDPSCKFEIHNVCPVTFFFFNSDAPYLFSVVLLWAGVTYDMFNYDRYSGIFEATVLVFMYPDSACTQVWWAFSILMPVKHVLH